MKRFLKAPAAIKYLFIYWLFWGLMYLSLAILFSAQALLIEDELVADAYQQLALSGFEATPYASALLILHWLLYILGGYYSWRLLHRSGIARIIIEAFSWILLLQIIASFYIPDTDIIPGLGQFEETRNSHWSDHLRWFLFLGLDLLALFFIRHHSVKSYCNPSRIADQSA